MVDEVDISEDSVKVDLHLTSPFCPAVFGFKICQDIHDNLLGIDGIENVPKAFIGMMNGKNFGKLLIRLNN